MDPDIGIEAAPAEIIMPDDLDVEGFACIRAALGLCSRGECQDEHGHYTYKESNVTSKFHRTSFHYQ
jgi:hypothetical protein